MFSVNSDEIRDRICDFRRAARMTQQDLAIQLDMKRGSYQTKEAQGSFNWEETQQIADVLEVSPFFIRYGVEDDEIQTVAKIIHSPSCLREPDVSVFGGMEKYEETNRTYISFLNLSIVDQNRILKYIEAKGY